MNYLELLKAIGITSIPLLILFIVIFFFGQKIINYWFDKKLERDKHSFDESMAEMQREFDKAMEFKKQELAIDLEKHRANLELESKKYLHELELKQHQFNIQFSKLHQDRAEVVKKMHSKLVELHSAMLDFTAQIRPIRDGEDVEESEKQRLFRVDKALIEFSNNVLTNSIFFEKPVFTRLDNIRKEYMNKGWDYNFLKSMSNPKDYSIDGPTLKHYWDRAREVSNSISKDFPPLIEELEDEFRKLLGVQGY